MRLFLQTPMWSSHQEETALFYTPGIHNWIQVSTVQHFVCVDCSAAQSAVVPPAHDESTFSRLHLWAPPYYFPLPHIFCRAIGAHLSCRLHYLSHPHGRTHSVPTTTCTLEMSGQPVYMPFATFAALKTHAHAHTHCVWIVLCLLLISWFKPVVQVQGLICLVCTDFWTALQSW